jgi:transposase
MAATSVLFWGAPHGALACRPCPQGLQAPPDHRRKRGSAGDQPDRRAPQRRHPAAAVDRRCRSDRGQARRPRRRAERLLADRGYDHDKYRRELRRRGVKPVIARRGAEHGSGLGKERWVVERTFAWLHNLRRLRTRYEHHAKLHLAFMLLGCAVVCQRMLSRP